MAGQESVGGCLRGAVRYRAAGAPVVIRVDFPSERFPLLKGEPAQYASSPGVQRGFCAVRGSTLAFSRQGRAHLSVTAATLDEPDQLAPRRHIF